MLQITFSLSFATNLTFKGGTSISKVWGLINRFVRRHRPCCRSCKIWDERRFNQKTDKEA
ncbi:nucleotidyl transferase AbiEii/AbiGii toxin family protein [Bacteroides sp. 51]|uniref:nucleotidyl transferase AbiEii/AbiGii toxin family protein n=1 Tax=Bacteroides sp. 51 TaxID=2302938 RepID=UPI00351B08B4